LVTTGGRHTVRDIYAEIRRTFNGWNVIVSEMVAKKSRRIIMAIVAALAVESCKYSSHIEAMLREIFSGVLKLKH